MRASYRSRTGRLTASQRAERAAKSSFAEGTSDIELVVNPLPTREATSSSESTERTKSTNRARQKSGKSGAAAHAASILAASASSRTKARGGKALPAARCESSCTQSDLFFDVGYARIPSSNA